MGAEWEGRCGEGGDTLPPGRQSLQTAGRLDCNQTRSPVSDISRQPAAAPHRPAMACTYHRLEASLIDHRRPGRGDPCRRSSRPARPAQEMIIR